jgi:hypothetical protein
VAWVLGADTLGGSAVLIWVPAAAIVAVYWSSLRPAPDGPPVNAASSQLPR